MALRTGGKTIDSVDLPLGVRTVKFDNKTGVSVNGRHVKLRGWGQKTTNEWPGLGAAMPDWMQFYTLDLMKQYRELQTDREDGYDTEAVLGPTFEKLVGTAA